MTTCGKFLFSPEIMQRMIINLQLKLLFFSNWQNYYGIICAICVCLQVEKLRVIYRPKGYKVVSGTSCAYRRKICAKKRMCLKANCRRIGTERAYSG